MKECLLGLCLLLITCFCPGQNPAPRYIIAAWPDNKKAAVSITFDDGISGQFTIALPALDAHHFKATFFVTTKTLLSQLGGWQLVQRAAAAGHEIANHSLTHPHFNTVASDTIITELTASNALIEENTSPQKSLTHAYPYGEGGQGTSRDSLIRKLVKEFFIGARATRNSEIAFNRYGFALSEDDYFKVNSDMIADSLSMAGFETQLDSAIAAGGWYVPTYHGIANGWIIVPEAIFKRHLDALEIRKDLLWIAPFATVLKYHRERNCARIALVSQTRHLVTLRLTDTLGNEAIWDQPLTINLINGSRKLKSIRQGDTNIPFTLSHGIVSFNAVPGNKDILMTLE